MDFLLEGRYMLHKMITFFFDEHECISGENSYKFKMHKDLNLNILLLKEKKQKTRKKYKTLTYIYNQGKHLINIEIWKVWNWFVFIPLVYIVTERIKYNVVYMKFCKIVKMNGKYMNMDHNNDTYRNISLFRQNKQGRIRKTWKQCIIWQVSCRFWGGPR